MSHSRFSSLTSLHYHLICIVTFPFQIIPTCHRLIFKVSFPCLTTYIPPPPSDIHCYIPVSHNSHLSMSDIQRIIPVRRHIHPPLHLIFNVIFPFHITPAPIHCILRAVNMVGSIHCTSFRGHFFKH